jgi:hypothetical protein
MAKRLKGFRDYTDYLSYAKTYLYWMDGNEHKQTYDMLVTRQWEINPMSYIREMSLLAHSKN